jgi:ubiquinone/menaquinone biosynthesis C-methylase UbiE
MSASPHYLLDNASVHAAERMRILAALFDEGTQRGLERTGLAPGWQCLEIGGGGGSVAAWLAARVGAAGHVFCTDVDTRHLQSLARRNVRVERHDIVRDALPDAAFDLIHARLVLMHIPEREVVLKRLVNALKPGGWLVIEDFDAGTMPPDSSLSSFESALAAGDAMRIYMSRGGVEPRFGRRLYTAFRAIGLLDVHAEGKVFMLDAAGGGTQLMRVNYQQIGEQLITAGLISEAQLSADIARLGSDDFAVPSPVMWTVAGRSRPR